MCLYFMEHPWDHLGIAWAAWIVDYQSESTVYKQCTHVWKLRV